MAAGFTAVPSVDAFRQQERVGPSGPPQLERAGPSGPPPMFDDSGLVNRTLLALFMARVAEEVDREDAAAAAAASSSPLGRFGGFFRFGGRSGEGFAHLVTDVHTLNARGPTARATTDASRRILNGCFPSLPSPTRRGALRPLPEAFRTSFAPWRLHLSGEDARSLCATSPRQAFRELFVARAALRPFSAKLNAWATMAGSGWLMGRSALADAPPADIAPGWGDGKGQQLKVERCRFLEARLKQPRSRRVSRERVVAPGATRVPVARCRLVEGDWERWRVTRPSPGLLLSSFPGPACLPPLNDQESPSRAAASVHVPPHDRSRRPAAPRRASTCARCRRSSSSRRTWASRSTWR